MMKFILLLGMKWSNISALYLVWGYGYIYYFPVWSTFYLRISHSLCLIPYMWSMRARTANWSIYSKPNAVCHQTRTTAIRSHPNFVCFHPSSYHGNCTFFQEIGTSAEMCPTAAFNALPISLAVYYSFLDEGHLLVMTNQAKIYQPVGNAEGVLTMVDTITMWDTNCSSSARYWWWPIQHSPISSFGHYHCSAKLLPTIKGYIFG